MGTLAINGLRGNFNAQLSPKYEIKKGTQFKFKVTILTKQDLF